MQMSIMVITCLLAASCEISTHQSNASWWDHFCRKDSRRLEFDLCAGAAALSFVGSRLADEKILSLFWACELFNALEEIDFHLCLLGLLLCIDTTAFELRVTCRFPSLNAESTKICTKYTYHLGTACLSWCANTLSILYWHGTWPSVHAIYPINDVFFFTSKKFKYIVWLKQYWIVENRLWS